MNFKHIGFIGLCSVALVACGGGSGGEWEAGVFPDASRFKSSCEAPRSGTSDALGSSMDEKMWLRSFSNDTYLWYDEIPDQNPEPFTVLDYFDELKTTGLSPSGQPKDKFHFTYDTEEWIQLSQGGISFGYGMQLAIDNEAPRSITVVYTEPNSPATAAGIARGARILEVDGTSVTANTQADISVLNSGLFPSESGESHQFVVQDEGESTTRQVTLQSAQITSDPVQNVTTFDVAGTNVGYLVFNDHIATAERELFDAITFLDAQNIDELVLDLRYNGGGFLAIAAQLGYMIAGPAQTANKTFELPQFNDKHPSINPVTGARIEALSFLSATLNFSISSGQSLPSLGLSRVYVLTGPGTCSASEAVINGLLGADVEVVQIGTTTCGKPYGFYGIDNCGTTYFTIQFRGVNDKGFGDFSDGFSPANGAQISDTLLTGCEVADDLTRQLGDPEERRLSAALYHIENGACPSQTAPKPGLQKVSTGNLEDPILLNVSPWRQNRIMGSPE